MVSTPGRSGWAPPLPSASQFRRWGVDPGWSQLVSVPGSDGVTRTWHVLDRSPAGAAQPLGTIVCVHGNPTWSYHWRSFHERLGDRYRVIAVDQLGMGYSERTEPRRFAERVTDLGDVLKALDVTGPVITAAYDWGGPISLGWALGAVDQTANHWLAGVVLCNTGVAVPAGRRAPALIRIAAAGPLTDFVGHRTRIFVDGTLMLSGHRVSAAARDAYRAPYRHPENRHAIAEFVADVPFTTQHPSAAAIGHVADAMRSLTVPTLLAWGARDPVFNDDFALDVAARVPHADRHRYARMGHLVVEETDVAALVDGWLAERVQAKRLGPSSALSSSALSSSARVSATSTPARPVWAGLEDRRADPSPAFVDGATGRSTSFVELHDRVMGIAGGLAALGVQRGDRVAVLVEPGVDLLATAYGCWRAGAVTVIADRGLGLRGLGAAIRAGDVGWVIGSPKALAAARFMRWAPGAKRIAVGNRAVLGAVRTLDQLASSGAALPVAPGPHDPAAVLYTSGATGPAKGVRYRHEQMSAQRDVLALTYGITASDRLVAAFAPFALYGPALGITSTIPDVDVSAPGTLTADALGAAVASVDASIVFASPAALLNVNRTARGREPRLAALRLVLSAGAPVPIATLRATAALCPAAELHTPYGMTECLPVADIDLAGIDLAGTGSSEGVCVGAPVEGVHVLIAPLNLDADASVQSLTDGATGEVLVRAPWVSDGYDQLWRTEHEARPRTADGLVWHRSGDVGHLDAHGRLWIEGRSVHVIHAVEGAITPVPVEVAVERLDGITRAAAVGIGPMGCQQLVVVVEDENAAMGVAGDVLTERVRAAVAGRVAAVIIAKSLPVDIRHNTKIDRTLVATWATAVLAGDRARCPW